MVRSTCNGSPSQPTRRSKRIASSESSVSADEVGSESQSSARQRRLHARIYRATLMSRNNDIPNSRENGSNVEPPATEAGDSADVLKSKLLTDGNREGNERHSSGNHRSSSKRLRFSPPELSSIRSFSERMLPEKDDEAESASAVGSLQRTEDNLGDGSVIAVTSENLEGKESENQLTILSDEPSSQRVNNDSKEELFSGDKNTVGCGPITLLERNKDEVVVCSSEKDYPAKHCNQTGIEASNESEREEDNSTSLRNTLHISFAVGEGRGQNEPTDRVDLSNESQSAASDACVICHHSEPSLCCNGRGCRRRYHLSCVETPLEETPLGSWYCLYCIQKKIKVGPHSLSEGIESVLDARVECSSDSSGTKQEKQYLVKYEGLAHVHNRWLSEKEMLAEAPLLLGKFNRKSQKEKAKLWKREWIVPERLLQKRLILPHNLADKFFSECNTTPCYYEWLVKWTFLGYEHATWEFENSLFLSSPTGIPLIKDFESRQNKERKSFNSSKTDESKRGVIVSQLPLLPEGSLGGAVADYLQSVNQLRECWHRGQSLILIDEQEKIIKVILFILSAEPDVSSPFLVISGSDSMLQWQSEFKRLAPSINVVAYCGSKDGRKVARDLDFYAEDGSIKFQVLLSLPESIIEDYDALNFFCWEALIVDDCQHFRVSKHLDQLHKLSSDFRLLLVDGQLQDNIGLYLSLISFLDTGRNQCSGEGVFDNSNGRMSDLGFAKERLLQFATLNRKAHHMKFLEYWVPVEMSTVQLEQTCYNLISHSLMLRSSAKIDHVGALSDILAFQRKCCDHPYLVDDCLQAKLTKDLPPAELLDVGVRASGKLQILDRILQEIRDKKQRALVLFQFPGRDGKCSIGDILDDFLRQRFGENSYERIDSGISSSRKQISLNIFNNKESGRFIFLIENRACLPSVRLSSVDAVIIYSGDWNPASDLRALLRIQMDSSSFRHIKVFRLYSSFTVEEKALILAKQNLALDSDIRNASCAVSRSLLSWGASFIFSKLEEFHQNESRVIGPVNFFEKPISDEVLDELLAQLSPDGAEKHTTSSMISEVQQTGTRYSKDMLLLGEKESPSSNEEPSHVFWSKLLDERNPKWRFVSQKSFRVRRRPLSFESLPEQSESEPNPKRSRATINSICDPKTPPEAVKSLSCSLQIEPTPVPADITRGLEISGSAKDKDPSSSALEVNVVSAETVSLVSSEKRIEATATEFKEKEVACRFQGDIHQLLKRDLAQLCETLQLSSSVSAMTQIFLEFIIANHRITQETETIVQAFMIALCWRAGSTLNQRLDHRASLLLARKHLNFQCTDAESETVYQKLRMLRKKSQLKDDFRRKMNEEKSPPEENPNKTGNEINNKDPRLFELEEGEILQLPDSIAYPSGSDSTLTLLVDDNLRSRIEFIEQVSFKRTDDLRRRHEVEIDELNGYWEIQETKLRKSYDMKRALIFAMNLPIEIRTAKLDTAEEKFLNIMEKFEKHMKNQMKRLISMQAEAKNKEARLRESWLAEVNAGNFPEPFEQIPLEVTSFSLEGFENVETQSVGDVNVSQRLITSRSEEMLKNIEDGPATNMNATSLDADARESDNTERNNNNTVPSTAPESGKVPVSSCEDLCGSDDITDLRRCPASIQQAPLTAGTRLDVTLPRAESGSDPRDSDDAESVVGAGQSAGVGGREGLTPSPSLPTPQQPPYDHYSDPLVNVCQGIGALTALPSAKGIDMTSQCGSADLPPSMQASYSGGAYMAAAAVEAAGEMTGSVNQLNAGVARIGGHLYFLSSVARVHGVSLAHDPLQLELSKIHREVEKENEMHEKEKHRLMSEMEKELAEVRRRYDLLLNDTELKHADRTKLLEMIHSKVYLNLVMAEELRFRYSERTPLPPAQLPAQGPTFMQKHGLRQGASVSGHVRHQASTSTMPPVFISNSNLVSRPPPTSASTPLSVFISNTTHVPRPPPGNTSTPSPPFVANTTLAPRLPANASTPTPAFVSNANRASYPAGRTASAPTQGAAAVPSIHSLPHRSRLPQQHDDNQAGWWQAPFPFS